jgi:hypothetical protein
MLLLLTQRKRIYFLDLMSIKDLLLLVRLKLESEVIAIDTSLINSSP